MSIVDSNRMDWTQFKNAFAKAIDFLPEKEQPNIDELMKKLAATATENADGKGEFKGNRIPPFFSPQSVAWQYESWKPCEQDVLVATFPKTGTTWVREIVRQLLFKDELENKISASITQFYSYLEMSSPELHEIYSKLPLKRRFYATHLVPECVNMERLKKSGCKVIYVMRNPKDQVLSWYHFLQKLPFYDQGEMQKLHSAEWNQFFETFVTGQQITFCKEGEWYPHHILAWLAHRGDENFMFIHYEDIKKEPHAKVKEISEFLGCRRTEEEIANIVDDTSFNSMRNREAADKVLLRKGQIGDWKNTFTVAQSESMDEKINEILKETDIKFSYE